MRLLSKMCFVLLASSLMLGQASTTAANTTSDDNKSTAEQIKALQQAMAIQQKQIEALQKELASKNATTPAPAVVNAAYTTPAAPASTMRSDAQDKPKDSPLSFRIGGTEFTPGGFVDFENIFRTTNTGNVTATSFWAIPYSNTVAGHLTEFRITGQYSRYSLKVTGKYGETGVTGYIEGDFNGNDAANVFVTSNSHTNRLRLYWVDLKRGKWEFLGGSSWGLMTPNRTGLSPVPSDLALPIGEDAQVHVGSNYTRAGSFRAGYHFNDKFQWAVGIENPQQFIGQGAEVIFPTAFAAALGGQFDAGATPGAPNAYPDFNTKAAFDTNFKGRKFHWELGGTTTSVKIAAVPTVAGATFAKHKKIGGGFESAVSFDLFKSGNKFVRVLGNGMWGAGIGRYLIGMGPQAVVRPIAASASAPCTNGATGNCDLAISMVRSGNLLIGTEIQPAAKTLLGIYYGGAYFQRNAFPDASGTNGALVSCTPGTPLQPKPCIGFGALGSSNIMNRSIQEATFDWTQTFWRNPQYGAVQLVTQTSYIARNPWFVPTGAPRGAHLVEAFVSMKYVLP